MDIKFHCSELDNFPEKDKMLRAFTYNDYTINEHNHDFYEINIVLGGRGVHRIENTDVSVRRGDVFIIPPKTVHSYRNTEKLQVYHILLKKKFIKNNQSESKSVPGFLQLTEIEPFLRQVSELSVFLHLDNTQIAELWNDIRIIEDNGKFDNPQFWALQNHTAWKILYYLSYLLYNQTINNTKKQKFKYKQQILDTLEYIHLEYANKITIDSLAKRVFLSRATFIRSFQSVCNCTPIKYLNNHRIQKAQEFLKNPDCSKTEVAHKCGFYDLSHMEKMIESYTIENKKRTH